MEEDNNIIADCKERTGFSKFRCNLFQLFQIIIFILIAMVFSVIAFDDALADPQRIRVPAFTSKLGPAGNVRILANPRFTRSLPCLNDSKSSSLVIFNSVIVRQSILNVVLQLHLDPHKVLHPLH